MGITWIRLGLIASILALLTTYGFGADTRPSTRPAAIDQVVNLPPISLKTKGLMPIDAFKMLEQATGIKIVPGQRVADGGNFHTHEINLWADRTYPKIDFDLESVSFWRAMDRLIAKADLDVAGDQWITLYPQYVSAIDRGWDHVFENPVFVAYARASPAEFHLSELWPGNAKSEDNMEVEIQFHLDPRIRICGIGQPVVEIAQDEANRALSTEAIDPISQDGSQQWSHDVRVSVKKQYGSKRTAVLRGYVPVQVVRGANDVEVPLQTGSKVTAGPWTIKLVAIRKIASNVGDGNSLTIEMERADKDSPPVPQELRELVQLRDSSGVPLAPFLGDIPQATTTATGGISESFRFAWARQDGYWMPPGKLVVAVPTEIREAALPFEFKDVQLP